MKMTTLMAIASLTVLVACADDGAGPPSDPDKGAASEQVPDALAMVKRVLAANGQGALADLGLARAEELDRLAAGQPLAATVLGQDALERWTPDTPVGSLVAPLGEYFVPVRKDSGGPAAFLLRIGRIDGAWKLVGFGMPNYAEGVGDAELASDGEAIVILQPQSSAAMALVDDRLIYVSKNPWQWDEQVTLGTVMTAEHVADMRDAARAYRDAAGAAIGE